MEIVDKPGKVINLVPVIVTRDREKVCQCYEWIQNAKGRLSPAYEIDAVNREVRCQHCGNLVDPIEALIKMADNWESINEYDDRLKKEIEIREKYKPWKRVLKNIEQHIGRAGEMVPYCPKCDQPFRLEQIRSYANEKYIEDKGWVK